MALGGIVGIETLCKRIDDSRETQYVEYVPRTGEIDGMGPDEIFGIRNGE